MGERWSFPAEGAAHAKARDEAIQNIVSSSCSVSTEPAMALGDESVTKLPEDLEGLDKEFEFILRTRSM